MLKPFEKNDIDVIMKIWKDNNISFQSFISNDYWVNNYIKYRDMFLNNKIYVYTEATKILAFIAINDEGEIENIQVLPQIQREGIGEILVDKLKKENQSLLVRVYKKNDNALLFFKALGFKKIDDYIDEEVNEQCYLLRWGEGDTSDASFIYFNSSIKHELIEKYDLESNVHFYNVITAKNNQCSTLNINIANNIKEQNGKIYIKDYIDTRNKLNSLMKTKKVIIYFDFNSSYDYLYGIIKDIAKVRNSNLNIIMHKPFSAEGTKKQKMYENILKEFKEYNFMEIDYESIGKDLTISFKEAFDKRDEEMLKMVTNN